MIHATDTPEFALAKVWKQLARIQKIARIPRMPCTCPRHIFVRLGLWQESISSNIGRGSIPLPKQRRSTARVRITNFTPSIYELFLPAKRARIEKPEKW